MLMQSSHQFRVVLADPTDAAFPASNQPPAAILISLTPTTEDALICLQMIANTFADTPIIIVSDSRDEHVVADIIGLGVQDYLEAATLTAPILLRAIQNAMIRKQLEAPVFQRNAHLEEWLNTQSDDLYRALERVEAILNNSTDAILLARDDGRIQQVNLAFEEMFGYRNDAFYGLPIIKLMTPAAHPNLAKAIDKVRQGQRVQALEVEAITENGHTFAAEIGLSGIMQSDGGLRNIVCNLRDVSERLKAEESLRQALEREQEYSQLKTRLIAMTSHEFRTPLTGILTTTDVLRRYWDRLNDEERIQRLDRVAARTKEMARLVDDMLTAERIEAQRLEINRVPVDPNALCRDLLQEVQESLVTNHRVIYHAPPEVLHAQLDVNLMREIFTNLVTNAIKYSPDGSQVTIDLSNDDQHVVLRVQDHGIGIPPNDLPHLFDPFYRGTNVGIVSGTGLGLHIAHSAVQQHGGTIEVESQEGIGTLFCVKLPRTIEESENLHADE